MGRKRYKQVGFLCFVGVLLLAGRVPAGEQPVLGLEQAVSEAVAANPGLAALKARAEALARIAPQEATLPDPNLTFRLSNLPLDTFSMTQEPMTQTQVFVSQALPYPGKLTLREQAAASEGEAGIADYEERRLVLVRDVKTVWWNLFYLDRALETVDRNQELLRQFVKIAATKYEVGKGLQQDVLLAQLELSKLLDAHLVLANLRQNEEARLNALLDRPANSPARLPQSVTKRSVKPAPAEVLMARALETRPLLLGLERRLEAAGLRVELARKDFYPDFTLGAGYGYRAGSNPDGSDRADFGTVFVGMSLPYFTRTRQNAALEQRLLEKRRAELALSDARKRVEEAVSRALSDYRRTSEQVELLETGILPQARQTVDSMLAGYQVNKVDFLNLVSAQTSLYNYETFYWRAFSRANQALARLAAAVGKEEIYE